MNYDNLSLIYCWIHDAYLDHVSDTVSLSLFVFAMSWYCAIAHRLSLNKLPLLLENLI